MQFKLIKEKVDNTFKEWIQCRNFRHIKNGLGIRKHDGFHFSIGQFDDYVGKLQAGKIYTVTGKIGSGKTTFILKQAIYNAYHTGRPVYIVHNLNRYESRKIIEIMAEIVTGIDSFTLDGAAFNPEYRKILQRVRSVLRELPIYLSEDYKQNYSQEFDFNVEKNSLIIFDDVMYSKQFPLYSSKYCMWIMEQLQQIAIKNSSSIIVTSQLVNCITQQPQFSDVPKYIYDISETVILLMRNLSECNRINAEIEQTASIFSKTKISITASYRIFYKKIKVKKTNQISFQLIDRNTSDDHNLYMTKCTNDYQKQVKVYIDDSDVLSLLKEYKHRRGMQEEHSNCKYVHVLVNTFLNYMDNIPLWDSSNNQNLCILWRVSEYSISPVPIKVSITTGLNYITWTLVDDGEKLCDFVFDKEEYKQAREHLKYENMTTI